jgi:AcrR family transcriptional regulator
VAGKIGYKHLPEGVKPWKNLWSAGQGMDLIDDIPAVGDLVAELRHEYVAACERPDMADVARLVDQALDKGMTVMPEQDAGNASTEPGASCGQPASSRDDSESRRLMAAAGQVLDRSGWWGLKVESVLRQARLSTRSFYRHFQGKNELLAALLEQELVAIAEQLHQEVDVTLPAEDRVWRWVDTCIELAYDRKFAKPASLLATLWRELLPQYPAAMDRCIDALTAPLADALRDGSRLGTISVSDANAEARAAFYLIGAAMFDHPAVDGRDVRADVELIVIPFLGRAFKLTRRRDGWSRQPEQLESDLKRVETE